MRFYVYELVDPRTGEPFYVGKGSGDRIAEHERDARHGSPHPKCDRIREIWALGLVVERRHVAYFREEVDAYDFEARRIGEIGFSRLTNVHDPNAAEIIYVSHLQLVERRFAKLAKILAQVVRYMALGDGHLYESWQSAPNTIIQRRVPAAEEAYLSLIREAVDVLGLDCVNRYLKAAGNVEIA